MKKFILSIAMVCGVAGVMAQNLTSYFMPDAIERRNINIALAPERGYFAIPVVGSTTLSLSGNLSVSSIVHETSGGLVTLLDGSISATEALANLSTGANFTAINNRLEILNFGGYTSNHRSFWSFNIGLRTNASVSLPYELFEFAKLGTENNIQNINLYAESFVDVGFGYSKMLSEKLTVGGRVKVLVGLARANLNISKFDIKMNSDEWSVATEGELNIYAPGLTSGATAGDEFDIDDIEMDGFSPAGFGVAIDLGAEYDVTKNLTVSLAANDVGFISWSQKNNVSATMSAAQSFAGVDVDGSGNTTTPDFSLDDISLNSSESLSNTKFLQANINAAAEYKLLNELIGVGVIYSAQFWDSKTIHNFVGSASIRPLSWITFAASYGLTNNSSNSLGLALNFSPCWFNLYIATDIITSRMSSQYIPIEQSSMNVSMGLAFSFGKRSLRSKYTKLSVD